MSNLLFGRIGPYFATHAQLDAFLRVEAPDGAAVERVRSMLARPVQRQYFFNNLSYPSWLAPLDSAGQFSNPPEMFDLGDGRVQLQPWPEGKYLIRMAASQPELVKNILLRIPKTIKNPIVWDAVTRAAIVLPAEFAELLTGHLECGLKAPLPNWFSEHVIPLVRKLAEARREGAFRLAAYLLWLSSPPADDEKEAPRARTRRYDDTEWLLARLEPYTLGEFLRDAIPALEAFKPVETIALLSKKLDRAVWLVEQGDEVQPHFLRYQLSTGWCSRLDDVELGGDVRAQLAVSLTGVATRTAVASEEAAALVMEALGKGESEIFQRIRMAVLTEAGQFLQKHLDDIIADPTTLASPPSPREYATLIRTQFNNASIRAQRLFIYALERGPEPDLVNNSLESDDAERAEDGMREIVAEWQRKRLRWFHDQIPEQLLPLAGRLGVESRKPDEEERALNEEGFYIGDMVGWVGDLSPDADEQFANMTPDALASYLETWQPGTMPEDIEGPTRRGLQQALYRNAVEHPEAVGDLLGKLMNASVAPNFISIVLRGFKDAIDKGHTVPWERALTLAAFAVRRAAEVERGEAGSESTRSWRTVTNAAARLIEQGCAGGHIPASESDAVWAILNDALRSPATWALDDVAGDFENFYSVISAGLNTLSGSFVDALIDAALWEYRRAHPGEEAKAARDSSAVTPRLVPLLEEILSRDGRTGLAAQAMLGTLRIHDAVWLNVRKQRD